MHQQEIFEDKLREAKALISRHIGLEIIDAVVHGSVLRGFNDPNSDIDICFLVNRPISDFLGLSHSPWFDGSPDERRQKVNALSSQMTRELGWRIMVTLLDMRSMLRGIMSSSPFSLMAYESLSKEDSLVAHLFDDPAKRFFKTSNLVSRCGEQVKTGMKNYLSIRTGGTEYKQERTFLGTLWSAHRLLAYMSGDTKHARTLEELMAINKENGWGERLPQGFGVEVMRVLKARVNRSPFDMPLGVPAESGQLLQSFVEAVLNEAAQYLRSNPSQNPSLKVEEREMVDLFGLIHDYEDDREAELRRKQA